jgi:hypothetical protein
MIRNDKDLLLSRIIAGFLYLHYEGKLYQLRRASVDLKYRADILYQQIYNENLYSDWILLQDTELILIDNGVWRTQNHEALKQIDLRLENLKVELYENYIQLSRRQDIKKQIKSMNMQKDRILTAQHSLDQYTLEAYAGRIRNEYLIMNTLYYKNKKVFKDSKNKNSIFLNGITNQISSSLPSVTTIRELARSDIWKSYWSSSNKEKVFDGSVCEWSDEQRALVNITKMFDSIYEHPECPSEAIIDDEDALEGWMTVQKRKNEQTKSKTKAQNMLGSKKMQKADEVFFVSNSKEETKEILKANDNAGLYRMKEKFSAIRSVGGSELQESQLPDVQRDLLNQLNAKRNNNRK